MADLSDAFEQVYEFDMWEEVLAILAGFFAPTIVKNLAQGAVPDAIDYDEMYGLVVVVAGQFSPAYQHEISIGGGLYTADKLAERANIKSTIVGVGA